MNFTGYDNANLFFDDSSSLRRESLSEIYNEPTQTSGTPYGQKSVYNSVFRPHPSGEGHHVHEPEHQRRPEAASTHAEDYLKSALRSGASSSSTTRSRSRKHQHNTLLANASYTYYDSKGDVNAVHESLKSLELSYVQDLGGFEVDSELSTIDNLVLNNKVTGETAISYRGTTTEVSKQMVKDWKINSEIAGGSTHTTRVKQAHRNSIKSFKVRKK